MTEREPKKKDRGCTSYRWKEQHHIILIATLAGIDLTALDKGRGGNGTYDDDDDDDVPYDLMSVCVPLPLLCQGIFTQDHKSDITKTRINLVSLGAHT